MTILSAFASIVIVRARHEELLRHVQRLHLLEHSQAGRGGHAGSPPIRLLRRVTMTPISIQLIAFYFLILVLEWATVPFLVRLSPMTVALIAFVPTPTAFLVAALTEGRGGLARLLRLSVSWRIKGRWYALAILIPSVVHLLAAGVVIVLGERPTPALAALVGYVPLTLILAAGEEIGWQGYAIPRLRKVFSARLTAFIFGAIHAAFHLPMYLLPLPDDLRQASPFGLFLLMATGFAIYRIWFFEHTHGNVPLIIVYHAAINVSVILLSGVDRQILSWLLPLVWMVAALPLLAAPRLFGRQESAGLSVAN